MTKGPTPRKKKEGLDGTVYAGLAALVAALAALVWWSLPNESAPPVVEIQVEAGVVPDMIVPEGGLPLTKIDHLQRAAGQLAVLTAKPEAELRATATVAEIEKRLDAAHCGAGCDVVKKMLADEDAFTFDVRGVEDVMLPPKEAFDTIAPGLTPAERDAIAEEKTAAVIDIEGDASPEQPVARTLLSVATVLAEMLDGVVYDETERRIFTKDEMLAQVITAPVGQPTLKPQQIALSLYRTDDGTARIVSLGMQRFGEPDLAMRGADMSDGPRLGWVLDAAAAQLVAGSTRVPVTITLADIAKVLGRAPDDLSSNPADARPVSFDAVEPEPDGSDPDNRVVELKPTRDGWDVVIASLFGASPAPARDDKELADVATKARGTLDDAVKRFQHGEGALFVKGPFPIAESEQVDGGDTTELLWIRVASCDDRICSGMLTNDPSLPSNIAPGKTVSVTRKGAADWLLRDRDGGAVGGESLKVLRARAKK